MKLWNPVFQRTFITIKHRISVIQLHHIIILTDINLTVIFNWIFFVTCIHRSQSICILPNFSCQRRTLFRYLTLFISITGQRPVFIIYFMEEPESTNRQSVLLRILRVDKCSTCIGKVFTCPVIISRFIQQIQIFLAGIYFSPSHILDIGIHTADYRIIICNLGIHPFYGKDSFHLCFAIRCHLIISHDNITAQ